jgi:hypothetical protein
LFVKGAIPFGTVPAGEDFDPAKAAVQIGLVLSMGEAKRLVQQNGIHTTELHGNYVLMRKGKKEYGLVEKN